MPSSTPERRAVVLLAHGARDAQWRAPFDAVATALRARAPALEVRLAFLEFMAPDLPSALAETAATGITGIDVVPLFLGAGGHVRRDVPRLIDAARAAHAGLRIELHPAIGELPSVIDAMADAACSLVAQAPR